MKKFDPADLEALKVKFKMTSQDLGDAIGYADASRVVRALVKGERHGKPFSMSGTSVNALNYLLALQKLAVANRDYQVDMNPTTEAALSDAVDEALNLLPEKMTR